MSKIADIQPQETYTIGELASAFRVSRNSVRVQLEDKKKGGVPFYKVGGQFRIMGKDVLRSFGSASFSKPTVEGQGESSSEGMVSS